MTKGGLVEDYIREHPGSTLHGMILEFGIIPSKHVKRLEREKRIYREIDLKDGKTKYFYSKKGETK